MKEKKSSVIRVRSEIHRIAKIAACEKLITLQQWIEQLIQKECVKKK